MLSASEVRHVLPPQSVARSPHAPALAVGMRSVNEYVWRPADAGLAGRPGVGKENLTAVGTPVSCWT